MTQPTLDTHYPCNVCGEVAIGCYRPDMDIKGLCFCAKDQEEVQRVYRLVGRADDKIVEKLMKDWKFT